jgi:hypothetical protein
VAQKLQSITNVKGNIEHQGTYSPARHNNQLPANKGKGTALSAKVEEKNWFSWKNVKKRTL